MSVLDDQAQQLGQQAIQGAQAALPQFMAAVQAQIPALQQSATQAAHDLGREAGAGAREGAGGIDTTTLALGGLGAATVLGLVVYAAVRAGTRGGMNAYRRGDTYSHGVVDHDWSLARKSPYASRYTAAHAGVEREVDGRDTNWGWWAGTSKRWGEDGGRATSLKEAEARADHAAAILAEALESSAEGSMFALHAAPVSRAESARCRAHWGGKHPSGYGRGPLIDPYEYAGELSVEDVELDDGGYTTGKFPRYFGVGEPLFFVQSIDDYEVEFYVRAEDRAAAVAEVKRCYPNASVS